MEKKINSSVGKITEFDKIFKQNKEKLQKKIRLIEGLINSIADNEVGREWLKFVYEISEFGSVAQDINEKILQRREAMRYFYVKAFRQFFNASTLKKIEGKIIDEENDDYLIEE